MKYLAFGVVVSFLVGCGEGLTEGDPTNGPNPKPTAGDGGETCADLAPNYDCADACYQGFPLCDDPQNPGGKCAVLCHLTPADGQDNYSTKCVADLGSLDDHLGHGDYAGECKE